MGLSKASSRNLHLWKHGPLIWMRWQPDSQIVYMYFELSLICSVFQAVSSSESKVLIFSESRVLENGAACSKGSSAISKTVAFMDSGRRCENKQGFVFISENISAPSGFTSAGLEALQASHLRVTEQCGKPSRTQTWFQKKKRRQGRPQWIVVIRLCAAL